MSNNIDDNKKNIFVETLNVLQQQHEKDDKLSEALKEMDLLSQGFIYNWYDVETQTIKLLKLLTKSSDPNEFIEWWIYETDFGKHNTIVEYNDVEYNINTPEDLYNFLNID